MFDNLRPDSTRGIRQRAKKHAEQPRTIDNMSREKHEKNYQNLILIAEAIILVCILCVTVFGVSKITCGFSKINCGMESWANGNSPKSVVGRNRWILNKKMVKKSGNRVTFGCLIWYKTYFLYYLNFGPFTACFLYGPLVLSVRKQTSFHGLGTAKMAAFFRCEKRKRFRICSKFP